MAGSRGGSNSLPFSFSPVHPADVQVYHTPSHPCHLSYALTPHLKTAKNANAKNRPRGPGLLRRGGGGSGRGGRREGQGKRGTSIGRRERGQGREEGQRTLSFEMMVMVMRDEGERKCVVY